MIPFPSALAHYDGNQIQRFLSLALPRYLGREDQILPVNGAEVFVMLPASPFNKT
jgi:hypothetical protein